MLIVFINQWLAGALRLPTVTGEVTAQRSGGRHPRPPLGSKPMRRSTCPPPLLIRKPTESKSVDLFLCKRLAQETCRCASAAESWATLVFGRLNREPISLHLAMELAELAEKNAAELRQLAAALVYELKS